MSTAGDPAGPAASTPYGRTPRLPRWTRQEILVLIEGKRTVELPRGGGRGGRARAAAGALEPKWAAVAEYCLRHGVERGAVQCRKRWSNLAGDFKKIKEWAAQAREPSFWAMRNDARRERGLPGFFDREVFDILEGRVRPGVVVAGSSSGGNAAEEEEAVMRVEEDAEEEGRGDEKEVVMEETVFDSGRPAAEEALFSEDEEEGEDAETPETTQAPLPAVIALPIPGTSKEKQPRQQGSPAQQQQSEQKRQRTGGDDGEPRDEGMADLQSNKLLEILDRNSRMVAAQLEEQNLNAERDREQRREQAKSLTVMLGRIADALGRIADKL